jgi:hypothetical protein
LGLLRNIVAAVHGLLSRLLAFLVSLVAVVLGVVLFVALAWGVGTATGGLWNGDGSSGVTVYPLMTCRKLCADFTRTGKKVGRFRLPIGPNTFRAFPDRQEVIMHSTLGVQSLTQEKHFTCTVMTAKTWECRRVLSEEPYSEVSYKMENGVLAYSEIPFNNEQGLGLRSVVHVAAGEMAQRLYRAR